MKQFMDDYSLFEYCLASLEAGKDLETILAQFPDKAGQLRPLLTAALEARQTGKPVHIPASAKIDSRTRFLNTADRVQNRQPGVQLRFRLAGAIAIVVFVLFAGVFGTSLASAKAVPGETLYPVKIAVEKAQLALTTDQSSRLDLEEEFDRRRVVETEKLSETGRTESVTIAGTLNETTDHVWTVGGVKLNLTPEQAATAADLRGSYVEVTGQVVGVDGLNVETMELRLFNISGILDEMEDNEWLVSGVKVLVMENTEITGKPAVGKKVTMSALHYDEEYFLALSVRVMGSSVDKKNQSEKPNKDKENQSAEIEDGERETPAPSGTSVPAELEETESTEIHETDTDDHQVTATYEPTKSSEHDDDHKDDD